MFGTEQETSDDERLPLCLSEFEGWLFQQIWLPFIHKKEGKKQNFQVGPELGDTGHWNKSCNRRQPDSSHDKSPADVLESESAAKAQCMMVQIGTLFFFSFL